MTKKKTNLYCPLDRNLMTRPEKKRFITDKGLRWHWEYRCFHCDGKFIVPCEED